ncbi:DNA polymerase III subunit gamma/tau [Microbacterium sp. B35-04]|uniref:DNA polymerase III subunit gamma/tau n=1 Tax=unclassified Microbacterium TaxID=2609290 RepID=UPI0013D6E5AA|nr:MULTISPECIES: DNA polymerase III subunit gamma/tau [unclassified Microbacterium]KAF2415256.1 DNA polymerase III subunit gamma/tau [Microbacterium sp. B35-04]KAF2419410.1 DNA polymerase III subunit gamma/tau [Microbacterium sp. B35-30]
MTTGRDDDALTWDGDDDPTLDVGAAAGTDVAPEHAAPAPAPASGQGLPKGYTAVGKGSDTLGSAAAPRAASVEEPVPADGDTIVTERRHLGNGALVALGVLGGVYALYAVGWIIGGLRLQGRAQYLVLDVMYQGSLWLAVLAPVLWFVTTLLLTRRSRAWVRFAWLAVGAVLLLPWPFVMIGAIGQ